jgi:acetylornithine deacetylase
MSLLATPVSDAGALLAALVEVPSVSGQEQAVAARTVGLAQALNLDARLEPYGVVITLRGAGDGPRLGWISHLDTVPAGEGWHHDPFTPRIEAGRLYGRGSVDAKGAVASMLLAAGDLKRLGLESGSLQLIFGFCEETKATSMPAALAAVEPCDAAVIGEPTSLRAATSQRGLMIVQLVARGEQRHAATGPEGNAILTLARDLLALESACQQRPHAELGMVTLTPTQIEAGIAQNLTPAEARSTLDIRSTPHWTHDEIEAEVRARVSSELRVISKRLAPCGTPPQSRLLQAAREARPQLETYGSPTCSDWVWVRDLDAIKCGPGDSDQSHRPDESIALDELTAARSFYSALARSYLS